MKYCSQCHQSFTDDGAVFCRNDGAALRVKSTNDLPATAAASLNSESKSLTPAVYPESAKIIRRHIVNPVPLLLAIGLICSVAIVAVILIHNAGRERGAFTADPQKSIAISRPEIDGFIQEWKQAWERRNIEAYARYYADSFVGNSYSANNVSATMNRSNWLNDKGQKFQRTAGILVGIGAVTVNYDGTDAVVSFLQDYQSDGYRDYGNKTLRLRRQSNGIILIVQEDFTP